MAEDWLNPLNGLALQTAVRARRPNVNLNLHNGKTRMLLTYEEPGKFYIKPENNLIPCGWFDIDKVLNPYFLERA